MVVSAFLGELILTVPKYGDEIGPVRNMSPRKIVPCKMEVLSLGEWANGDKNIQHG